MNARIIRRQLMRNRSRVLWGERAYLTVRLPAAQVFVAPPPPGWTPPGGKWWLDLPCGGTEGWDIACMSGDPRGDGVEHRHHITPIPDEDGWYTWWEGVHVVERDGVRTVTPLPAADIDAYVERRVWEEEHLHTAREDEPVMAAFVAARFWARSMDATIVGEDVFIQYGIKWFHPRRVTGFCSDLRRAIETASRAGVRARIVKQALA